MAVILLIDDDALVRQTARAILETGGYSVTEAKDGKEGLKWLNANQADLVLTDIFMPGADGVETILTLRQSFPTVKIIAMSGSQHHEHYLNAAGKLGADAVLDKPFRHFQLLEMVRLVLSTPSRTASSA